jgi:SnoaL-like polyketide cyclase
MTLDLDRLLRLWLEPIGDTAAAEAAFREVYADPVMVNGTALTVAGLVERARALQAAYEDLQIELVDRVETQDRVVIGFRMQGRQVGPLPTPLGTVAPTGRAVATRVTDILTVAGGLVTDIWVVSDDLGTLMQLGAVALT